MNEIGFNYYCEAFREFFAHAVSLLADLLRTRRRGAPFSPAGIASL